MIGGGGSSGNAWLIGLIAGLAEAGVDITAADRFVGTSAGATTAAQALGGSAPELLAATLAADPVPGCRPAPRPTSGRPGHGPGPAGASPVAAHLDRRRSIIAASSDAADMRRRMGVAALEMAAGADPAWQARWRETVASRLPGPDWPRQALLIPAVDAETGEPVVFDADSGIDLVDAVAASCSSALPYRIGARGYIDGAYRANAENADLAAGCGTVLVLAPLGGRTLAPEAWGTHLAAQVAELRASGAHVEVIVPDPASDDLFGANAMDPSLRAPAARLGRDQGRAIGARLAAFWA